MNRRDKKQTFCYWRIIQRPLTNEVEYNEVQEGLKFTLSHVVSHGLCVCLGGVKVLELAYVCKEAVFQMGLALKCRKLVDNKVWGKKDGCRNVGCITCILRINMC